MQVPKLARIAVLSLMVGVLVLMAPGFASAHSGEESYVYLDIYDTSIEGQVEFPVSDINEILGLSIPSEGEEAQAAAEANVDLLHDYAQDHFALAGLDGTDWPIAYEGVRVLEIAGGSYIVLPYVVDRSFVVVPRQFTVAYDGIIRELPDNTALLIIATDFGSGTFKNEADALLRFTPATTVQTVDLGETSFWRGFTAVIGLGVEHIRIGTDHILFIFALVLPAVLVFSVARRAWEPAESFGSSLWRVTKIVTVFTIAHSVTLALGGFGIIELPPELVETIIAISIALAALNNIKPVVVNREWMIAGIFGLFHGFGFAGLLADLGLTQSRQVASLLGFNLGIEIGQVAIILMVFPALFIARRTRVYLPAMYLGSAILIAIALAWAMDRALGIDLRVDALVDRVVLWPRSLIFLALLYAVATGLYYWEKSRGTLLPVAQPEGDPTEVTTA